LQPVFVTPPENLIDGTFRLGFMFTGLETLLLVAPFLPMGKKMGRSVVKAIGFAGVILTVITMLTIAAFGRGVVNHAWPVLVMMDMLNLPGAFIERQEALMFSFWIITTFALVNGLLFFGGVLVTDMLKLRSRSRLRTGVIVTSAAVFAVTLFPLEGDAIYLRLDFLYMTLGLFYLVALPLLILAAARIDSWARNSRGNAVKSASILLVLVLIALSFTSCWDMVEIEDRAFAVAIAIDKADDKNNDDRFIVTLSVPPPEKEDEEDDDGKPAHIKYASGKTITEALKQLDTKTDKRLYYGQAKLLILGEKLLEEKELLQSAVNAIYKNREIDRRIHVLAAEGKAADILEATPSGETLNGLHVSEIYRDKNKIGGASFALDFERLSTAMNYRNGAVIPRLSLGGSESIQLDGAVVIRSYSKKGILCERELRGYLWAFSGGGNNAVINIDNTPVKIERHRASVHFETTNDSDRENLRAVIEIKVDCIVKEGSPKNMQKLKQGIADKIAEELVSATGKMQDGFALDGYDWLEIMRKKQNSMYEVYSPHWQQTFAKMEIVPYVFVELKV